MVEKHGWAPYIESEESIVKQVKVSFYPECYAATKSSVASLIKRFNNDNGFDLQKFLGPQHGLDRKLNNLINYAVSNGMKSSDAEAVFEKVSTVHYKVDVATEAEVKSREKDYKDYSHRFFVP